ncbi:MULTISPECIES: Der GTPase-activating protein YihI [Pseudoalteromonas]|uniref:Der GTPase-activating protein YihI n=1 Tax=Pseudoalteromonas TaxID=53246 RepID=UPI0015FA4C53|nr:MULTISPECIES: Der GTPase-activating protein YihI [Pseudoalteromonas]MBB1330964.1 GTPase-activating protein [Pseudoalteromonas sp. SR43-7]MBB1337187.1 GTPase-activating protein [Pseudoalteromonas sp. SR44-2]MBB1378270.1 GTPase-activating protein [Pseudoalteromonas sp. SR43-2]MBD0410761.1 GTPase-activating protein [Pseudoalteromonas distincta]
MSRTKKSRKSPANGPVRLSQDKLKEMRALKEQRVKKTKGAKPGSRNAPDLLDSESQNSNHAPKDKRVGSKKPVPLIATAPEPKVEMKRNLKPTIELKKVIEPEFTPEQELEALENDERLLKLVERHEKGEMLTGKDAKYFNSRIARHQALCEILGIEDEDEDEFEDDLESQGSSDFDQYLSDDLANEWLDEDDK